jgi:MFS transporter, Spinster family, sphingosine-1-phosphate transporter
MPSRLHPWLAVALLASLNFLNYVDRNILFAVQPPIKQEFHVTDAQLGWLTSIFFIGYLATAPIFGYLADRFPRRTLMAAGALVWSAATLLTAVTHTYSELLVRHAIVGIGEASFVTIAPAFIADLFSEDKRGRALSVFYMALPFGSAVGYILGSALVEQHGWRAPFYVGAVPGLILALLVLRLPEPERGSQDTLSATADRSTLYGLGHNHAFWTATLAMAMYTFSIGGLSVWMPTFLNRVRGVPLGTAGKLFGVIIAIDGIIGTLFGGWIGDRLLRRSSGAYYWFSGISMSLAVPAMAVALWVSGPAMFPAILVGGFILFLNTGPMNAAIVNAVSGPIRATAIAINIFTIHLLGDVFSPPLIGRISDATSLQTGLSITLVAAAVSAMILFYGARFAPKLNLAEAEVSHAD